MLLWSGKLSPFSAKVRIALAEKGLAYDTREVRSKPDATWDIRSVRLQPDPVILR